MKIGYAANNDERLALLRFAGRMIPHAANLADDHTAVAIGVLTDESRPAACVVFNHYIEADKTIMVHVAAVNPLWTRGTIVRDILAYPFFQLGCNKVWAAMPIKNKHAIDFNKKLGFTREGILRYHIANQHAVITGLLRKEYLRKYWPENSRMVA